MTSFIQIQPPKPRRVGTRRPTHGVRGFAIRMPDGTCFLFDADQQDVTSVWLVGERGRDYERLAGEACASKLRSVLHPTFTNPRL